MWSICHDIDEFKLWWECQAGIITDGCDLVNSPSIELKKSITDIKDSPTI